MTVEILGTYPTLVRGRTGLFSLDMAMRDRNKIGIPMRTIMELYGYTNAGKSTLAYYLSGKLTGEGNVSVCDLEFCDREYVSSCLSTAGMNGSVKILSPTDEKGKPLSHENMLLETARDLYDEEFGATILDSVGGIVPNVEQDVLLNSKEKELGQAFMGKRAKLVGQFARAVTAALRNKERPSLAIVINHLHQNIGSHGHTTAGGENLKYLAASRVMIWPGETIYSDSEKSDVFGFLVRGQIEKLRYGSRGRSFQFYIVPGYGVHEGASALYDCLEYGLAESKSVVKIGDKSFGYLKANLLKLAAEGNTRRFEAFQEELLNHEKKIIQEAITDGGQDVESNGEENS